MNIYNYDVSLLTIRMSYSVGQRSSSIAGMGTTIYRQGRTKIKIIYTISWRRQNRVAILKKKCEYYEFFRALKSQPYILHTYIILLSMTTYLEVRIRLLSLFELLYL